MKMLRHFALMTMFVFFASARADVPRHPIKLADLPAAVRKTALQQKGRANIRRLEKTVQEGKEIYELELRSATVRETVFIDATGTVLEVKQPITLSEISRAAKVVIESSVGNGTIITLESVKTDSGIIAAYEVTFNRNDKQTQLRIGPDGRLVQE